MFKKTFSILAAFVFGLVISISILACADDISDFSGDDAEKELLARVLALEKEMAELKSAKTMQSIGSYTHNGVETRKGNFEYDEKGRIVKITCEEIYNGLTDTDVWTCSYSDNVCTVKKEESTEIFVLANEKSRDFSIVQQIIVGWAAD